MNSVLIKSAESGGEVFESEFMSVVFQKGLPSQVGINGCRAQDVIQVALDRLRAYQRGPLSCVENEEAIHHLRAAITALDQRIERRREQGVLNTLAPHEAHRTEDEEDDFSATGA